MARRKEYDRTVVLDKAMATFWHQGYEATSMRDLVEACGLSTRSMYDGFGDKAAFFDTVLEHYHQRMLAPVLDLFGQRRGLDALRAFVDLLAADGCDDGCLFVNTSSERHVVGDTSVRRVDDYTRTLRSLFTDKLLQARSDGDFGGDVDARTTQLAVTVTGFMASLRGGVPRNQAATALRSVLADIERDR